jgi:hypothetical protein
VQHPLDVKAARLEQREVLAKMPGGHRERERGRGVRLRVDRVVVEQGAGELADLAAFDRERELVELLADEG